MERPARLAPHWAFPSEVEAGAPLQELEEAKDQLALTLPEEVGCFSSVQAPLYIRVSVTLPPSSARHLGFMARSLNGDCKQTVVLFGSSC